MLRMRNVDGSMLRGGKHVRTGAEVHEVPEPVAGERLPGLFLDQLDLQVLALLRRRT